MPNGLLPTAPAVPCSGAAGATGAAMATATTAGALDASVHGQRDVLHDVHVRRRRNDRSRDGDVALRHDDHRYRTVDRHLAVDRHRRVVQQAHVLIVERVHRAGRRIDRVVVGLLHLERTGRRRNVARVVVRRRERPAASASASTSIAAAGVTAGVDAAATRCTARAHVRAHLAGQSRRTRVRAIACDRAVAKAWLVAAHP